MRNPIQTIRIKKRHPSSGYYTEPLSGLGQSVFDDTGGYFDFGGDTTVDWGAAPAPTTEDTGIIAGFRQRFQDAVNALDAKVTELNDVEARLFNIRMQADLDEVDAAEWQTQYNKVLAAQSTVQAAQNAVNEVSNWWNGIKSYFTGLAGIKMNGMSGLGLLPAIPWGTIALITAGTAAIAAVIYSANQFIDRMNIKAWNDENIRRSQEGLEPLPKPETSSGPSLFADISDLGKVAIVGFAVFFLLPPLLKRIT